MKPRPDGTHRGNVVGRGVIGERLGGLRLKRIGVSYGRHDCPPRLHLRTADDHHEQFVQADQRDRRPRSYRRTDQAMAQTVCHVGRECRRNAQAEQPPRQHHHRAGIDQSVHCERDQAGCSADLTVRPDKVVGVLVRRHRGHRSDADRRPCG
jgi:hypothetical protein